MSAQVVVGRGMTSEEADELIALISAPPSTATNVKKVKDGNLFNVEATFPKKGS